MWVLIVFSAHIWIPYNTQSVCQQAAAYINKNSLSGNEAICIPRD